MNFLPKRYSSNRRNKNCLFSLLFSSLCLLGLVIHAFSYTFKYFSYATLSDIDLAQSEKTFIPKVSVCFSVSVLLSKNKRNNSVHDLSRVYAAYTLREIFDLTMPASQVLQACSIRMNATYLMMRVNSNCTSYLKIDKLFRSGFLCYRFNVIETTNVSREVFLRPVSVSQNSPGALLSIVFSSQLEEYIQYFNVFTHYEDLPLAQDTFIGHFSRAPMNYSMFYITYNVKTNRLMSAPYDSNCLDYSRAKTEKQITSRGECFQMCVIKQLQRKNYSLSMELTIDEKLMQRMNLQNMKYTGISALHDSQFASSFERLEHECEEECERPDCETNYYTTRGITATGRYSLSLVVYMPSEYRLEASKRPQLSSTQYFSDILSALSIWFGLSFFGTVRALSFLTCSHYWSSNSKVLPVNLST